MFGSIKIAKIWGIPIRLHFTLILLLPYFAHRFSVALETPTLWGWLAAATIFMSVALHELGHSIVALRYGCPVRDIVLTPIGGIAQLARIPSQPKAEFQIAIAGPLVSLALAIVFLLTKNLIFTHGWFNFGKVVYLGGVSNAVLFAFNLLPCFPMDGGRIFRAMMSRRWGRLEATRRAVKVGSYIAGVGALLGFFNFNLFWIIMAWFIHSSAQSEYRAVQMEEMAKRGPSPWNDFNDFFSGRPPSTIRDIDVEVSPPPYRK